MYPKTLKTFGPRMRFVCCIAVVSGLFAVTRRSEAGDALAQTGAPALPTPFELFLKLSPAERHALLEKAGLGDPRTHKVVRAVLRLDIVERGGLETARTDDLICMVRGGNKNASTTVKWVIEDGAVVKKGDKLIVLDDSEFREELNSRGLELAQALAAHAKVQEKLELVQTENEIDVRLMEISLQLAELRLQRDKGEDRNLKEELQLKVEQSRLGLRRAQGQARAQERAAQADLVARTAAVEIAKVRKTEAAAELPKCVLTAPRGGVVTYYVPDIVRGGRTQQTVVAVGEPVREGQKLLQMPDLSELQVNARVHEAHVAHLRNADPVDQRNWQPVQIRVDAFPERVLKGHVKSVDNMASPQDFFATDVKVFKTIVAIDTSMDGLKPGMSAEVIITAQQALVLHVPVQAVLASGKKRYCFVLTDKEIHAREVITGLNSDRDVEIKTGLKEGDSVLASPRPIINRLGPWLDKGAKSQIRKSVPPPIVVQSAKPADVSQRVSWVNQYGLTFRDLDSIANLPAVCGAVPIRSFPQDTHHLGQFANAQVVATTAAYADVNPLRVAEGRFLNDDDNFSFRNVAVLGSVVADRLFPGKEALGATFVLNKDAYLVVGVLGEHDLAGGGPAAFDVDRAIFIPIRTCQARFGERIVIRRGNTRTAEAVELHSILVTVEGTRDVLDTIENIRDLLEQAHAQKDWVVQGPFRR
jgi:HlyD family secretion protein